MYWTKKRRGESLDTESKEAAIKSETNEKAEIKAEKKKVSRKKLIKDKNPKSKEKKLKGENTKEKTDETENIGNKKKIKIKFGKKTKEKIDETDNIGNTKKIKIKFGKKTKEITDETDNTENNKKTKLKFTKKDKQKKPKVKAYDKLKNIAANVIFFHDKSQDVITDLIRILIINIVEIHHNNVEALKSHRREIIITGIGFFFVMFITFTVFNENLVYSYSYNGRELGYVEKEEDVIKILDLAGEALSEQTNADIQIVPYENITFSTVSAANKDVDDIDTVLKRLTYMTDLEVKAYGIYADGKLLTIVEDQDKALKTLSEVKEYFMPEEDGVEYLSAEFKENIEFIELDTVLANINTPAIAANKLIKEEQTVINHTIKADETYEGIANLYGISEDALMEQNSGVDKDTPQEGEVLFIVSAAPKLTLITVENRKSSQELEYEVEEKESSNLYEGEEYVSTKGSVGKAITEAEITRENGKQTEEDIIKQEILVEAVTEVVLIGTKEAPPSQGTGTYITPVNGAVLSATYGMRWGRMHYGIDLAAPIGTPIHAADGGTIIYAGYKGAYGYCIIIDHGSNNETLYGHCSTLAVSVGDKVFKDQIIGAVGNTGTSTGPHCHFEVHINGSTVDPQLYL